MENKFRRIVPDDVTLTIRTSNLDKSSVYTKCPIIAGYYNTGKSVAVNENPQYFVEIDYRPYKYRFNMDDKTMTILDDWQSKYVDDVLELANKKFAEGFVPFCILICTDSKVLKELESRKIYYMVVAPDCLDTIKSRKKDINADDTYSLVIDILEGDDAINNFDEHMKEIEESSAFGIYRVKTSSYADIFCRTKK